MVYHAGIHFLMNKIFLYNTENKKSSKIIITNGGNNIVDIYLIFELIVLNCDGNLGCASVLLYSYHGNDIRKKFIEMGKKSGFKNVEIISLTNLIYFNAVSRTAYRPNDADIIWIFYGSECHVWEKRNEKAYFIARVPTDFIKKEDFESIKVRSKLIKDPNAIIYNIKFDQEFLKAIFPCSKLYPSKISNEMYKTALLIKARILEGDEDVIAFDSCNIVCGIVIIKNHNKRFMSFNESNLPAKKAVQVTLDKNDQFLTVNTHFKTNSRVIVPNDKEILLTFEIDENGIISVTFDRISLSKSDFEHLREKIEKYDLVMTKNYKLPLHQNTENRNVLGIDFGTNKFCVAANRRNGVETIPLDNKGERLLPSYVSFDEKNEKCGQVVVDRFWYYDKSTVFDIKRFVGKSFEDLKIDKQWNFKVVQINNNPLQLKGYSYSPSEQNQSIIQIEGCDGVIFKYPEELIAVLLKHIKQQAEDFQEEKIREAVISIPARFTKAEIDSIHLSGFLAEFEKVQCLPEPIAAFLGHFKDQHFNANMDIFVFDLGGGILNLSVLKFENNELQIVCTNDYPEYNGKIFDEIFFEHFIKKLNCDDLGNKKHKLMVECNNIKHSLSVNETSSLEIEAFDKTTEGFIDISRQEFESLSIDILLKMKSIIASFFQENQYSATDITDVLQVGGGCRMPMIKRLLQEIFPEAKQCCNLHPEEITALGAAYFANGIHADTDSTESMSNTTSTNIAPVKIPGHIKIAPQDMTNIISTTAVENPRHIKISLHGGPIKRVND